MIIKKYFLNNKSLSDEYYKNKSFYAIDLFKFLFSIAIIMLHFPLSYVYASKITKGIFIYFARLAVPFFFIASGYFLFKKLKYQDEIDKKKSIKKYLKKIAIMYIVWTIFNLPLLINTYNDRSIIYNIKRCIFVGTYGQFWFLHALLLDIPIIFLLNKKVKPQIILIISSILYLFGCIGFEFYKYVVNIPILGSIYNFIFDNFITTRNFLFCGLYFVAIGNFFANNKFILKTRNTILIFIIFSITMVLENFLFTKTSFEQSSDMRVSLIPLSFIVFYIIAHIELKERKVYYFLRNMSMLIYCSHRLCAELIFILFKISAIPDVKFYLGFLGSISLSFIVTWRKKKQKKLHVRQC